MTTAMFIAGPVTRNNAAAIGRTMSIDRSLTPSSRAETSIAGSEPVDDWVEKAIAWVGAMAFANAGSANPAAASATA